jgi:hypothetical protein
MTAIDYPKRTPEVFRQRNWRPLPWQLRWMTWVLLVLQTIVPIFPQALAIAQSVPISKADATFRTPPSAPEVTVNRTVPDVQPPSTELQFSNNPTDEEISRARVFDEPIVSIGKNSSSTENADLAQALLKYRDRQDSDDASAIENCLQTHPDSPHYISLQVNLAAHYRRTSQFSKALATWQQVWASGKNIQPF